MSSRLGGPARVTFDVEVCHGFGVCGGAVPMECHRPIPLFLRGLRSNGTPTVAGGSSRATLGEANEMKRQLAGQWLAVSGSS